MSSHPWSLFARGAAQPPAAPELRPPPCSQARCGGEADANSSDEDEDIPTKAPSTTVATGSQRSLASLSLSGLREFSSRSLEGYNTAAAGEPIEAPWRGDLEGTGASEELIARVEDMLMDNFYRSEARIFKVECGLTTQVQVNEEQQRYVHDLSERLSHVSACQRADRKKLQEREMGIMRCGQPEEAPEACAASAAKLAAVGQLDRSQHNSILSGLRRDFDEQMARHEERFASLKSAIGHCNVELSALRAELARDVAAAEPQRLAEVTRVTGALCGSMEGSGKDLVAKSSPAAFETGFNGSQHATAANNTQGRYVEAGLSNETSAKVGMSDGCCQRPEGYRTPRPIESLRSDGSLTGVH